MFKLPLGGDPLQGRDLPSRPTLSRFENAVTADAPSAMSAVPARCVLRCQREQRPETSIVELDFDPPHGHRQLALFNSFCDTHCYLPLVGAVRRDAERQRHLVAALPRSGTAADRLLPLLREFFPRVTLRLRLDAGFQGDELLAMASARAWSTWCACRRTRCRSGARPRCGRPSRPGARPAAPRARTRVGKRRLRGTRRPARSSCERSTRGWEPAPKGAGRTRRPGPAERAVRLPGGPPVAVAARDRQGGRKRVSRARPEVVTNEGGRLQRLYERTYRLRGDVKNRVKELKQGMRMGRVACSSFAANQFRAPLAASAYAIMQELRWQARETPLRKRQVDGLRLSLPKPGGGSRPRRSGSCCTCRG